MGTHLLQDLAIVMAVAAVMTLICHRLRQPVVIGYLLAGLLIGPYTPPFSLVSNLQSIHTMAELGLVFLLFSLGLEFNLPKIRKVGVSAGLAAVLEVVSMLGIGYLLGRAFGWNTVDSVFLGAILSISSTTIIVKVFMDFKMMGEKFVQVVFGILVLEDIVAVVILSILSGLGRKGGPDAGAVAASLLNIGLFVVLFLVLGLLLIPPFIRWVAGFKSKEVLGIVTLSLCLGGAQLARSFQLSIALGAFLIGAVLAASPEIDEIEEWIHPVRDMFSAIFFVSAGMLIQPKLLIEHAGPIAIVAAVTLVGKVLSGAAGSFLVGYDPKTSVRVGMSLAQIGEFSFVIASLGTTLNVTSEFLYPLAVTVSSLTTLATPFLIRNSDRFVDAALGALPARARARLERYQTWVQSTATIPGTGHGTAIFSRYLVRLGVYAAVLVAALMSLNAVSFVAQDSGAVVIALWTVAGVAAIPLFRAISKYANHILLLLVTRSKRLLRHLDVHGFYRALDVITGLVLLAGFLACARRFLPRPEAAAFIGAVVLAAGEIFRKPMRVATEWLETSLDGIMGLATSDPTRQAVLRSGDRRLLLVDITDQVALPAGSFAVGKTVREIGLREKTGASVVAIYRQGNHIANPGPDLALVADDVLILLGNDEELAKARNLFLPSQTQSRR